MTHQQLEPLREGGSRGATCALSLCSWPTRDVTGNSPRTTPCHLCPCLMVSSILGAFSAGAHAGQLGRGVEIFISKGRDNWINTSGSPTQDMSQSGFYLLSEGCGYDRPLSAMTATPSLMVPLWLPFFLYPPAHLFIASEPLSTSGGLL